MQQERSFERRRSFAIKIHQANHKILHLPFITKDILKTDTTIKQINIAWPYLYIGISLWKKLILERINHMPLGIKIGVSTKDRSKALLNNLCYLLIVSHNTAWMTVLIAFDTRGIRDTRKISLGVQCGLVQT